MDDGRKKGEGRCKLIDNIKIGSIYTDSKKGSKTQKNIEKLFLEDLPRGKKNVILLMY